MIQQHPLDALKKPVTDFDKSGCVDVKQWIDKLEEAKFHNATIEDVKRDFVCIRKSDVPEALKAIDDLEALSEDGMVANVLAHFLRSLIAQGLNKQ